MKRYLEPRVKHKRWTVYHYNAVAKEIREMWPKHDPLETSPSFASSQQEARTVLTQLALSFARRFQADWEETFEGYAFDPLKFLDACSGEPELYPISELWERYKDG